MCRDLAIKAREVCNCVVVVGCEVIDLLIRRELELTVPIRLRCDNDSVLYVWKLICSDIDHNAIYQEPSM
jgi:hypothetical protein